MTGTSVNLQAHEAQIQDILDFEIPELVPKLPYSSWYQPIFTRDRDQWRFQFECNHATGRFFASAQGASPREAYALVKHKILQQVHDWHYERFASKEALSQDQWPITVLIVEDDPDQAVVAQKALEKMGFHTEVATQFEGLHTKIITTQAEYILLDWQLNGQMTADKVFERAHRLLDAFSDLRARFIHHKPKVITYSVLPRDEVILPTAGDRYFTHFDHWQKPLAMAELIQRAAGWSL